MENKCKRCGKPIDRKKIHKCSFYDASSGSESPSYSSENYISPSFPIVDDTPSHSSGQDFSGGGGDFGGGGSSGDWGSSDSSSYDSSSTSFGD